MPVVVERAIVKRLVGLPPGLLRRFAGPPRRSPEGYVLDTQVQALLRLMVMNGQSTVFDGDIAKARHRMDRDGALLDVRDRSLAVRDVTVQGAVGPRRARVYTPAGAGRNAPGLVFFHGGGFVLGSIESHDGVCRGLAAHSGVVVVSVDYRLAPEHPFPAPTDDATAATRWILENAASLGVDDQALAVGGDSAGGALAIAAARALRGSAKRPAFQLLLYPATDATRREASHKHFREGFMLTERSIDWIIGNYLPDPSTHTDPRASPLLADDLSGMPPGLVLTAGFDPLRDEGRKFAERLRAAGAAVEHVCSESSIHGFMNMAGVMDEPARLAALAADRLRRALSRGATASVA
ncbi:MAG TPA: alpha/beta hydrolase [Polyangiaceae bacterium]|nr:alpha/beta hydrolase [Polyangiaceae bacterium]